MAIHSLSWEQDCNIASWTDSLHTTLPDNTTQSKHVTLTHGSYCIQWNAKCRWETVDFFISSVSHRKVEGWTVSQGAIDLFEHFKRNSYSTVLPPIIPLYLNFLPRPTVVHVVVAIDYLTLTLGLIMTILAGLIALLLWKTFSSWWVAKHTCTPKMQCPKVIDISILEEALTFVHQADFEVK